MTADLPGSGDDQETIYTYGVAKGASAGDSKIGAGHLLYKVQYPDSSGGSDVVTYAYNAQGQLIWQKDQAGNVIEFDYDTSGRREHQRVTTLAGGFDGAVRRITSAYDDYGRVETVTQYDNAAAGSGTAVDQVKFTYDDWASAGLGGVSDFEQDHNGLVGAGGSVDDYEVEHTYFKATNGRRTVRQAVKRLVYASTVIKGYTTQYASGASAKYADELSRASNIRAGATDAVTYDYMGLGTVVGMDHGEPEIYSHLYGSTSGDYPDLDRFNRVTTSAWTKDLGGGATDRDFYDVDISYDRNSNITVIEDNIHSGWDFDLTMDDLNRLIAADRGTWSGSAITSPTYGEVWDLDQAGNWQIHQLDLNGDTDYLDTDELDDDGTFNKANELTARDTDDDGFNDIALTYDAVGNMTDDGTYDYVYDAFGRLRQVKDQSANLVEENWYNGLGYRIVTHNDVDGDGDVDGSDEKFHLVYDTSWRLFAEFRGADTDPKSIYLHHNAGLDGRGGSSYIDALVFRERDANGNGGNWDDASDGTLEERLYYCQNWRADVVALITDAGEMAEGTRYSPYGVPFGMPLGDVDGDGDVDGGDSGAMSFATPGDVRQDLDLDGDVDINDLNALLGNSGATLGRGVLSGDKDDSVGNTLGYAGYVWSEYVSRNHVRHRVYDPESGRWSRRDPLGYVDGPNLYGYVANTPVLAVDYLGAFRVLCGQNNGMKWCQPADGEIEGGGLGYVGPTGGGSSDPPQAGPIQPGGGTMHDLPFIISGDEDDTPRKSPCVPKLVSPNDAVQRLANGAAKVSYGRIAGKPAYTGTWASGVINVTDSSLAVASYPLAVKGVYWYQQDNEPFLDGEPEPYIVTRTTDNGTFRSPLVPAYTWKVECASDCTARFNPITGPAVRSNGWFTKVWWNWGQQTNGISAQMYAQLNIAQSDWLRGSITLRSATGIPGFTVGVSLAPNDDGVTHKSSTDLPTFTWECVAPGG